MSINKLALLAIVTAVALSGCAYQKSLWSETETGRIQYHQTNVTPPFGRQAESAGQMSATILEDGTWELVIGRTDVGVDNTVQAEMAQQVGELLLLLGKVYTAGGM
jgi:hypothetical protein